MRIPAKEVPLSCCAVLAHLIPRSPETTWMFSGAELCLLGMKKGVSGGQSREPAGHQGSDWEELGDTLSVFPIPALCPWSFKGAYITSFPALPPPN